MSEKVCVQQPSNFSRSEKRMQGFAESLNSSTLESSTDSHAQEQLSVQSSSSRLADVPDRDELVMPFIERAVNEVLLRHRCKTDLEEFPL